MIPLPKAKSIKKIKAPKTRMDMNVKVIDVPFNNFSAVVEVINEDKKKLTVSVKIFGRKTPVELSYMQVEKE